jgi:hypothetical protein
MKSRTIPPPAGPRPVTDSLTDSEIFTGGGP